MADALAIMAERAVAARRDSEERTRRRALRSVLNGHIEWRAGVGPDGGFTGVGGTPLNRDINVLVALWELLRDVLICLDGQAVKLTLAGERQLAEWERGGRRG